MFRRLLAALALSLVGTTASAQPVFGTYTMATPQGGTITLTLTKGSGGAIAGSLSGNGMTLNVAAAEMQGEDVRGALKNDMGGAYFHAHRVGDELRLTLVDPGANGQPDMSKARQITLTRQGATAAAPGTGAGSGTAAGAVTGETAEDTKLIQLLESRAWCSFSFSGGSTYTGGSYGSTNTSRVVFSPNGLVSQTAGGENVNTGAPGNVYGSSSNGQSGRWKVQMGQLWLSADGVQWAPQRLKVELNSNGYPIVTSGGKEYMGCK